MTKAADNKAAMYSMIARSPRGVRFDTIMRKTGMSRKQVFCAAAAMQNQVAKKRTADGGYTYILSTPAPVPEGLAVPRPSIPLYLMQTYTGNTPTHRISL